MIKPPVRAVISLVLAAAPIALSACATAHEGHNPAEAILLNPQDAATRQAIRIFVREKSGSNVITNPDSLAQTPILVNNQRRTESGFGRQNSSTTFKPTGEYRLVMDENQRCWLVHRAGRSVTQMELPASANCTPYRAP